MSQLKHTLQKQFQLESFRPGQKEAIETLLTGRDALVVMPTGAGKSLIYQLASFHRPGLTLVISPLIALMQDQVEGLERRNIRASFINSTLTNSEQKLRLENLKRGRYEIVYVAPERLKSVGFRKALEDQEIGLLAVDEAHCISQWGHDFRPDYRDISEARKWLGQPLTIALTATATPLVQKDIAAALEIEDMVRFVTGFNRPNLTLLVSYTSGTEAKYRALKQHLDQHPAPTIIYVGTRRETEEVALFLREVMDISADYYHAGLANETRYRLQEEFTTGKRNIIVATNAFGMGIDRPDVGSVIHFNIPGTLEAYYQEAGRAGRDGRPAQALLLYDPADRALQEWFIDVSRLTLSEMRTIWACLRGKSENAIWTTEDEIAAGTDIHPVKVKVALAQLKTAGALVMLGDVRARTLVQVNDWNEGAVKSKLKNYGRIISFRRQQLVIMIGYAECDGCRRKRILNHFGDQNAVKVEHCCDNCLTRLKIEKLETVEIDQGIDDAAIGDPSNLVILHCVGTIAIPVGKTKLAQILSGSRAAAMRRLGYDRHPAYGSLGNFTQREIRKAISAAIDAGELKTIGGEYPVLRLTLSGKEKVKHSHPPDSVKPNNRHGIKPNHKDLIKKVPVRATTPAEVRTKQPLTSGEDQIARIVRLGNEGNSDAIPELIDSLEDANGNVRRLAASALGKIGDPLAVDSLLALLLIETKPQVRQYAVKALGKCGEARAVDFLEIIANDASEKDYTRKSAEAALKKLGVKKAPDLSPFDNADSIRQFLNRAKSHSIPGPWTGGWALDYHSRFEGARWERTPTGKQLYRLKYEDDKEAALILGRQLAAFCQRKVPLEKIESVVPVPPSKDRDFDPVLEAAHELAAQLEISLDQLLTKTRPTLQQKEMKTLVQKEKNVQGAFGLTGKVKGRSYIIVDDLYDSGATMREVYRLFKQNKADKIYVLAITRTIHTDA